jgi:hypothetical protein
MIGANRWPDFAIEQRPLRREKCVINQQAVRLPNVPRCAENRALAGIRSVVSWANRRIDDDHGVALKSPITTTGSFAAQFLFTPSRHLPEVSLSIAGLPFFVRLIWVDSGQAKTADPRFPKPQTPPGRQTLSPTARIVTSTGFSREKTAIPKLSLRERVKRCG